MLHKMVIFVQVDVLPICEYQKKKKMLTQIYLIMNKAELSGMVMHKRYKAYDVI